MSQNSNSIFKHEYRGESFPFCYESKVLNLYLQADSENKLYKVRFETQQDSLKDSLERMASYITDKHLDHLILKLAKEVDCPNFEHEISLLHFQKALRGYSGQREDGIILDQDEIICRCSKVDLATLESSFIKSNAKKSEILKLTNASMICGSCQFQLDDTLSFLAKKHSMFEGQTFVQWKSSLQELIEQFSYYSPAEFEGAKITLQELELPNLNLDIHIPHQNLTPEFAKTSLENYLGRELGVLLNVSVAIYTSLSN